MSAARETFPSSLKLELVRFRVAALGWLSCPCMANLYACLPTLWLYALFSLSEA